MAAGGSDGSNGWIAVLVAFIGAAALIIVAYINTTDETEGEGNGPSPSPSQSPTSTSAPSPLGSPTPHLPTAQVEVFEPHSGSTAQPGQNITVAGSVVGLAGDTLWVVIKPDTGGQYYLTQGSPVTDRDGQWRTVAYQVGDDSDRGHSVVFLVLQANRACSERLAAVPVRDDVQSFTLIPDGCVVRADRAVAVPR